MTSPHNQRLEPAGMDMRNERGDMSIRCEEEVEEVTSLQQATDYTFCSEEEDNIH